MDSIPDHFPPELPDTGELVFRASYTGRRATSFDAHWYAWDEAHGEAEIAYEAWQAQRGRTAYAVYRAAQDRADAAQDALAARALPPCP